MRLTLALSLISLAACDAAPPPSPPPSSAGEKLALGTLDADGGFAPYIDGQDVTLVAGAQGGFHVWMSYQMTPGLSLPAMLERTANRASDDALILRTMSGVQLDSAPSAPLPMFMCPAPVGISVIDIPIVYQLRFTDDQGEIARGQVTLTPHCPTDQITLCQRICNG